MAKVVQTTSGKVFSLIETTAAGWRAELPSDEIEGIFISEGGGNINGSVFCYWIGEKDIENPDVLSAIQAHVNNHDVVGVRFIRELPSKVHPALTA